MSDRYLIAGLGNPGRKYQKTRHNIGFMTVDRLARSFHESFKKGKGPYQSCSIRSGDQVIICAQPMTFMNNSGMAVRELVHYFDIDLCRLLIIYDDADLLFGRIRMRKTGGAGGHNGVKSVIQHLNTKEFARLRIGIGSDIAKKDMINFVLSGFSKNEHKELDYILDKSVNAALCFVHDGIDTAMNQFNQDLLQSSP